MDSQIIQEPENKVREKIERQNGKTKVEGNQNDDVKNTDFIEDSNLFFIKLVVNFKNIHMEDNKCRPVQNVKNKGNILYEN